MQDWRLRCFSILFVDSFDIAVVLLTLDRAAEELLSSFVQHPSSTLLWASMLMLIFLLRVASGFLASIWSAPRTLLFMSSHAMLLLASLVFGLVPSSGNHNRLTAVLFTRCLCAVPAGLYSVELYKLYDEADEAVKKALEQTAQLSLSLGATTGAALATAGVLNSTSEWSWQTPFLIEAAICGLVLLIEGVAVACHRRAERPVFPFEDHQEEVLSPTSVKEMEQARLSASLHHPNNPQAKAQTRLAKSLAPVAALILVLVAAWISLQFASSWVAFLSLVNVVAVLFTLWGAVPKNIAKAFLTRSPTVALFKYFRARGRGARGEQDQVDEENEDDEEPEVHTTRLIARAAVLESTLCEVRAHTELLDKRVLLLISARKKRSGGGLTRRKGACSTSARLRNSPAHTVSPNPNPNPNPNDSADNEPLTPATPHAPSSLCVVGLSEWLSPFHQETQGQQVIEASSLSLSTSWYSFETSESREEEEEKEQTS